MDAGEHDITQDPGWRAAWRGMVWMLSPAAALVRQKQGDDLLTLRAVFVACVAAVVGATVPVTVLVSVVRVEAVTLSPALVAGAVAAVGLGGFGMASRPVGLDCADDERLAGSYRQGFLLRVGFAQLSTMLGYLGSVLTEDVVPYLVGAAFSLASLSRIAPTAAHLARDQQALTAAGCPRSLIAALRRNANRPPL